MIIFSSNIPLHYYFELLSFNSLTDTILKTYEKETRGPKPWVAHLRMTDKWSETICDILVECIMRNNSVKLF